jgi:hypothetical protein
MPLAVEAENLTAADFDRDDALLSPLNVTNFASS